MSRTSASEGLRTIYSGKGIMEAEGKGEDGAEEKEENRLSKGGRSQIGCDAS